MVTTANAVKSFYSIEPVKEFRVVNSLYTAEQGHAIGGTINVVTRSGTNEFHGGVYEFLRNDKLDARDLLTSPDFQFFRRNQFGATLGGPVKKEKLFNFYNTDDRNDRVGAFGIAGDPITSLGARHLKLCDQGLVFNLISTISARLVNQLSFSLHEHDYRLDPRRDILGVEVVVVGAFSTGADVTDELGNDEGKIHLNDHLSCARGAHQLKFGAEYIRADIRNRVAQGSSIVVPGMAALLQPEPVIAQARLYASAPRVPLRVQNAGLYAQDQWQGRRGMTLNYGLRYDVELVGGLNAMVDNDLDNFQPRFGFAYSFGGKRTMVARGGAGLFAGDRLRPYLLVDGFNHGLDFPNFNEAFLFSLD